MNTEQEMRPDLQQRLVEALYGPGVRRSDSIEELADALIAVAAARRSSDEQAEVVGWETPAEWDLEQRAFQAANSSGVPEWARETIKDLWRQYCLLASPPAVAAGGVTEALREALTSLLAFTKFELDADMATRKPWSTLIAKAEAALSLPTPPSRGEGE